MAGARARRLQVGTLVAAQTDKMGASVAMPDDQADDDGFEERGRGKCRQSTDTQQARGGDIELERKGDPGAAAGASGGLGAA